MASSASAREDKAEEEEEASSSGVLAWYNRRIAERPLVTKQITGGLVSALSAVVAKVLTTGRVDPRGAFRQFLINVAVITPLAHTWHKNLDGMCAHLPTGPRKTVIMTLLDQSLFNPTINACFLTVNSIIDGFSSEEIARRLRTLLPGIVASSLKVWGTLAIVNYSSVPVQFRVLTGNLVGFFWTIWLLLSTRKESN
jgi:hypothetical protein